MAGTNLHASNLRPAGYAALVARLGITVPPNWHESLIASGNTPRVEMADGMVRETYPSRYWPGDDLGGHLEFALKYDGVNLAILAGIFRAADTTEITAYVTSKPTGKYARRVWYLYEWLTGDRLPLDDVKQGNYVDLLEPDAYITTSPARQVRRQRINDNLLGDARFCPIIRRTETIQRYLNAGLRERCRQVLSEYPPELLRRALSYLYTRETKSSFEIEHIKPSASRTERFIVLLELARKDDFCDKARLIDLQNRIVDPRFADADYRTSQNYVGETVDWQAERVHYACPKPKVVPALRAGLIEADTRIGGGGLHPVLTAAAVAYGFVFLHPFEDGNGRIHRFLIHNILASRGFTPEGLMFPVSAAMLKNPGQYDASLEAFSKPLMPLVEYELDDEGRMTVLNDTARWYRFIDMTPQAEALFAFIEKTIETELVEELNFLANYDRTKAAIQEIVDMPDRRIDLFIRFCLQNHGQLSARKRSSRFAALTDDEITRMEQTVQTAYGSGE
ncbi:MAG: Fic family protein [Planctomycetes bacterium]|nr:Fic family protein [Planctomycetota bacterium]